MRNNQGELIVPICSCCIYYNTEDTKCIPDGFLRMPMDSCGGWSYRGDSTQDDSGVKKPISPNDIFQAYQKALNTIDDYFEYRALTQSPAATKKFVMDTLSVLAETLRRLQL